MCHCCRAGPDWTALQARSGRTQRQVTCEQQGQGTACLAAAPRAHPRRKELALAIVHGLDEPDVVLRGDAAV